MRFLFFIFLILALSSCNLKKSDSNVVMNSVLTSNIVAEVNGDTIRANELDQLVSQQIFDELNRIYNIRSIALDYLIDTKIIEQEARKGNLCSSDFLDKYYNSIITESNIDSLLSFFGLHNIPTIKGTSLEQLDKSSYEGKIALKSALELSIKKQLLDSLKKDNSEIHKYVYPPKSPKLNLVGLPIHYRGNIESKVSMVVVSDFECEKCIKSHDKYNEIYNEYKDLVKFGSINFSSTPTFAGLASNAADKQNKYWEFHDSLFAKEGAIDSLSIYDIAKNLNLDIRKFDKDLHSESSVNLLNTAIDDLVNRGLFATPTIIINGRLIFDSGSSKEIAHLLYEELKK